jgi:DNA-binding XRE family transcriptional regulator
VTEQPGMPARKVKRATRTLTSEEKARYAKMAKRIEEEFPPGQPVNLKPKPTQPATLGDYFGLRSLVAGLRAARQAAGLSLTDIQHATGIDRTAISRLENAEHANPTINTLTRYARAVGREIKLQLVESEPAQTD